jgi:DNA polymerase elongation subunit (family B)
VNSAFGVMGLSTFRLYDNRIASAIAFLIRDLLLFAKDEIEKKGFKVVYWDTDSLFIKSDSSLLDELNNIVQLWGKKYGKESISIEFEYEGHFDKLFILTKCRYLGDLRTDKGIEREIKGIEIKRSSSSKYEGYFQEQLITKVLNKENKDDIQKWIEEEKIRIKTLDIVEIGFPCKMSNTKSYQNEPIFVRAYSNTRKLKKSFKLSNGEPYYYIFTKSMGFDDSNREINVVAFTQDDSWVNKEHINYDEVIRRNIVSKVDNVYDAMKWVKTGLFDNQLQLF